MKYTLFLIIFFLLPLCANANNYTLPLSSVQPDTTKPKPVRERVKRSKIVEEQPQTASDSIPKKAKKISKKEKEATTTEKDPKKEAEKDPKKEKIEPPKLHPFAIIGAVLGLIALIGLAAYFVMPMFGLIALAAIPAGIFGFLANKKIKKEPLKWKGINLTTIAGMSMIALFVLGAILLVNFLSSSLQ